MQYAYKMQNDYLINLIGSFSLAVHDAHAKGMAVHSNLNQSEAAAVITLGGEYDYTINSLSKVLGLSHSATTRMVTKLCNQGLIERSAREDHREVGLALSIAGQMARDTLIQERHKVTSEILNHIPGEDQAKLADMLQIMLHGLTTGRGHADHICRLCDETVCTPDICPVELKANKIETTVQ